MALVFPAATLDCTDQAICTHDLSKKFGDVYGVKDLNLQIPTGIIFGYIGPSGSGKTTTIRLLTGIYPPTSGEVQVLGHRPADFSREIRARIGYLPQLFSLYPNLSVWENMNFMASVYGIGLFNRKKLMSLLEFVELEEHRNKLARDLSGGMQRRLNLAATLVQDPDLIFLDEPTAGVDPVLRNRFWEHFRSLSEEGRTLFVTTQYVGEVTYCDRVAVMGKGELLVVDTPEGLRKRVYGGEIVELETEAPMDWRMRQEIQAMPFVQGDVQLIDPQNMHITVDEASTAMPELMTYFKQQRIELKSIQEYLPPYDDVFVKLIEESEEPHV